MSHLNTNSGQPLYNYDRQYHGTVTMRTAITKSYNIPAVKAMVEITPEVGVEYLKKFGFTSILDTLTELLREAAISTQT